MQLSFLNEFTYFSNDEAIDRVVTKDGVRFVKLKDDETPYGLNELIQNISSEMFIVSDLHIGDPIDDWTDKRDKIISTINNIVGKNDKLLILGDLTAHSNTTNIYDVVNFIKCLKCENLYLVLGNNDIYSIDSYKRMGFKAVVDKVIWRNYIFTHMPIPVTGKEINIHGHLHEEIRYENVDWHNHIRIWDDEYKPITFREVVTRFESGYYKGVTMTSDELKAEWEAKQKIEEIETSINSVFDEIEKLSEEYDIPIYLKNVYKGFNINKQIPLYEGITDYNGCSGGEWHSFTDDNAKWLFNNSMTIANVTDVQSKFIDYHWSNFSIITDLIDNILKKYSKDGVEFVREVSNNNININVSDGILEKLTVLMNAKKTRVFLRDDNTNRLFGYNVDFLSGTYFNSMMKNLYTYNYIMDNDIVHRPEDAFKLYNDYTNRKLYSFIVTPYSQLSEQDRVLDRMIIDNIQALRKQGINDNKIAEIISEDFFSDRFSSEKILKNAEARLKSFIMSLKSIRAGLVYNAASFDQCIQHLIDAKNPVDNMKSVEMAYKSFVPELKLGSTKLVLQNGSIILLSEKMLQDLLQLDRKEQIIRLVNPIWYAMNGYDYVIYGHGMTRENTALKYPEYKLLSGTENDFYIQRFNFDRQYFYTLNSILDYLNERWTNKDKPCKIMVLSCNERPEKTVNALINKYNKKEFDMIDVTVASNRVVLEATSNLNYNYVYELYKQCIVYYDRLNQDALTIYDYIDDRLDILNKLSIKNFYHQGDYIDISGERKYIIYRSIDELKKTALSILSKFSSEIDKCAEANKIHLMCIKNYLSFNENMPDENKVAFVGEYASMNNIKINDYTGCLESSDEYIFESDAQKYVYVCTFYYKSIFGSLVQMRTLSKYNHAAIALNSDLNPMYTYVRENPRGKSKYNNKNGFSQEFLSDLLQKDPNSEVKVIAIPVSDEQYETMEALIQGYENNIEDTNYDFGNIIAKLFNIKRNVYNLAETDMVCSEFVAYMLFSIGFRGMSTSVNLTTPKDISQLDKKLIGAKCIYEGKVKDYKK